VQTEPRLCEVHGAEERRRVVDLGRQRFVAMEAGYWEQFELPRSNMLTHWLWPSVQNSEASAVTTSIESSKGVVEVKLIASVPAVERRQPAQRPGREILEALKTRLFRDRSTYLVVLAEVLRGDTSTHDGAGEKLLHWYAKAGFRQICTGASMAKRMQVRNAVMPGKLSDDDWGAIERFVEKASSGNMIVMYDSRNAQQDGIESVGSISRQALGSTKSTIYC